MEHSHDDAQPLTCPRQGFSRQETMVLTDLTSSRLAYLDRTNVINPTKYGDHEKSQVVYSWEQLLQLRAINYLKQKISLETTRKIVRYLDEVGIAQDWGDRHLVIVDENIFTSNQDWSDMPQIMKDVATDRPEGFTVVIFPKIDSIISDVWRSAFDSGLIDAETFVERAKKDTLTLLNC